MLSVFTLLHPEAARPHAALLAAAAAVGDFEEWAALDATAEAALYRTRDAAVKLDAALRQLGAAAGGDAAAYDVALQALPELLAPGGCAPPAMLTSLLTSPHGSRQRVEPCACVLTCASF